MSQAARSPDLVDQGLKFVKCSEEERRSEKSRATTIILHDARGPRDIQVSVTPVKPNPLWTVVSNRYIADPPLPTKYVDSYKTCLQLDLKDMPFAQPHHSWRKLLVTDPPPRTEGDIHLCWWIPGKRPHSQWATGKLGKETFVTLGSLVDAALEIEHRVSDENGVESLRSHRAIIQEKEAQTGKVARFAKYGAPSLSLYGIIVPRDDEWKAMEQSGEVI